jgi:hypothetical protein
MSWFTKRTQSGKYRLENEQGHVLHDDNDAPIEFDAPEPSVPPKIEEAVLVQGETLKPDPAIEQLQTQLAASNAKVDKLTGLVEKLLAAGTRSIEQRAEALANELISANKIVPSEAEGVKATFAALAKVDEEAGDGSDLAGDYARRLGGSAGHGWTSEVVAPGRSSQNASLPGGLEGLAALASGNPQHTSQGATTAANGTLPNGRKVLDPGRGTEAVGGEKPKAERLAELLSQTDAGRYALGRIRKGDLDVQALRQRVGLS